MTDQKIDPGYGYRVLEPGEEIQRGDHIFIRSNWATANLIGGLVKYAAFRRPIDVGEGYRLLGLEEEIQAGDEWAFGSELEMGWNNDSSDIGALMNEVLEKHIAGGMLGLLYRRPLTAEDSRPAKPSEDPTFKEAQASIMCGCGHHEIDPSGDLYRQHANWMSSEGIAETSPDYDIIETCFEAPPELISEGPDLWGEEFEIWRKGGA